MSRYAYLVCEEAKQYIFLGKIVSPDTGDRYFGRVGGPGSPPNSEQPDLMKSLMKFLAAHMGKTIRVFPEEEFSHIETEEEPFVEVGAREAAMGILMSEYIKGFEG